MVSAAPVAPIEPKPLSEVERVIDTFVAPSKTFTDLRRSANWLVPWLLLAIASVALVFVVDQKLGMGKVVGNQLAMQPKRAGAARKIVSRAARLADADHHQANRVIAYAYLVVIVIVSRSLRRYCWDRSTSGLARTHL